MYRLFPSGLHSPTCPRSGSIPHTAYSYCRNKSTQAREHPGHSVDAATPWLPCNGPHGGHAEAVIWPGPPPRETAPVQTPATSHQRTYWMSQTGPTPVDSTWSVRHHVATGGQPTQPPYTPWSESSSPEGDSRDAPTKRGWWGCKPYAGSTSATSAQLYDVIRYWHPGKLSNTNRGTSLMHQRDPPGTSQVPQRHPKEQYPSQESQRQAPEAEHRCQAAATTATTGEVNPKGHPSRGYHQRECGPSMPGSRAKHNPKLLEKLQVLRMKSPAT